MRVMRISLNGVDYNLELVENSRGGWDVYNEKRYVATFFRTIYSWRMDSKKNCALTDVLNAAIKQLNSRDFKEERLEIHDGSGIIKVIVRSISDSEYIIVLPSGRELLFFYSSGAWRVRGKGAKINKILVDNFIHYLKKMNPIKRAGER